MDLSIIIVSWKVKDKLWENLQALFASSRAISFEVFVVDNNSGDGTVEMVKNEFKNVNLIANPDNFGFAKANNQAIKEVKGDYVLLLNPDMKIFPDSLVNMLEWMKQNPRASVAGCHLINEKGETIKHVRRFPTVRNQLAIIFKLPHLFPKILDSYIVVDFDYGAPVKVDSVRGGFFMIKRETINKVGLLDERYFLWFEEVDFCLRVKESGGEVWYTPAAECIDYVGQSFKQVKRGTTQRYFRDSMLKYFKKWHPVWQYWLLCCAWPIGLFIALVLEKAGYKSKAKT
ncbi:MAG: glycosyltransferase family 2 protein [Parcubacteria group bacterium]